MSLVSSVCKRLQQMELVRSNHFATEIHTNFYKLGSTGPQNRAKGCANTWLAANFVEFSIETNQFSVWSACKRHSVHRIWSQV